MQWNCLRSLSCCCRRAGDVLLCFKCTLEPDASKMLVVYDPNVCFEWIHDDVLADMNARHPIWWARDIATRFETWHRQRIRLQNRKWLKHLMLLSYTEYFWSLAPTRIQFGFPFLSSSFFQKGGSLYEQETDWWMTIFLVAPIRSLAALYLLRADYRLLSPHQESFICSVLRHHEPEDVFDSSSKTARRKETRSIICVSLFRCNNRSARR